MRDFYGCTLEDLEQFCRSLEVPEAHAKTLFRSAYKDFAALAWQAPSLPRRLREACAQEFSCSLPSLAHESLSRYDGTVKFLVRLTDGAMVEAVLMPEKKRITLCISSQVGCAQACSFCYTGRMGLQRQLSPGEIVAQVWLARDWLRQHPDWIDQHGYPASATLSNLVFMGMGEPLDNVEAVMQALSILIEPVGMYLALRKISVSTAGHLDGLKDLLARFPDVSLALSLHASNDRERSQLMPINRRWPLGELLDYLRNFYQEQRPQRSLLVQYTVIRGVNDSAAHAHEIVKILHGLPVKLNLIPLNEVEPSRFRSPEPHTLEIFRDLIHAAGVRVMVRYSKGQDIAAACGQLVIKQSAAAAGVLPKLA